MSSPRWPDSGIGGVEVAYVYPLATAATEFGSDALLADLRFAAERAHDLGLSFDLTLGSGWSFGGRHISTELAARQLHWERREIGPGPLEVPVVSAWPGDELIPRTSVPARCKSRRLRTSGCPSTTVGS